jgi:hypothetical protein
MTKAFCLLAQLSGLNRTQPVGKTTGLVFMNVLAIIVTGLALGLVLLLWARFHVRGKKRHHRQDHGREVNSTANAPGKATEGAGQPRQADLRHHRRRRHRRDHRPRNPTLGETGGLPQSKIQSNPNPPL